MCVFMWVGGRVCVGWVGIGSEWGELGVWWVGSVKVGVDRDGWGGSGFIFYNNFGTRKKCREQ